MTTTFEQAIGDIYRSQPDHILPFIGSRYVDPDPGVVRVFALGINAYVDEADWPSAGPDPRWYATWYANATYRYQRAVQKAVGTLATGLPERPSLLSGRRFYGRHSTYATNAIKVYLPSSRGKRASQLTPADFGRHREQWHQELRVMAGHNLLPHLLVVFGEPSWATAWQAFCPSPNGTKSGLVVRRYMNRAGPSHHYLNRIAVELEDGHLHELLLVRLRHPSARTPKGSPPWLLRQADFHDIVGCPPPEAAPC